MALALGGVIAAKGADAPAYSVSASIGNVHVAVSTTITCPSRRLQRADRQTREHHRQRKGHRDGDARVRGHDDRMMSPITATTAIHTASPATRR